MKYQIKKGFVIIVSLMLLAGCTQVEKPEPERYTKLRAEFDALKLEYEETQSLHDDFLAGDFGTFKNFVDLNVEVIKMLPGDYVYGHHLLVKINNDEDSTPIVITVTDKDRFERFEVGESYDVKIYIINVIQDKGNETRFEFTLY